VFAWLLLMDRLNVRNILRRKKHKLEGNNYNCPICNTNPEETTFHLFFSCPFSLQCWNHLHINWNFNLPFHTMIEAARTDFSSEFFMETFMLGAWLIWKQRNGTNFSRGHVTFHRWKKGFIDEAALQAHRMKGDKHTLFSNFLNLYR
jgi:hypothetical protein